MTSIPIAWSGGSTTADFSFRLAVDLRRGFPEELLDQSQPAQSDQTLQQYLGELLHDLGAATTLDWLKGSASGTSRPASRVTNHAAALALLDHAVAEGGAEDEANWAKIKVALEADRLGRRKLFR